MSEPKAKRQKTEATNGTDPTNGATVPSSLNDLLTGNSTNVDEKNLIGTDENHCEVNGITLTPVKWKEDLTPQWLSLFLNRKIAEDGFTVKPTGTGQMSSTVRVRFHEVDRPDHPESLIVKFASHDTITREMGLKFGHYLREAIFYRRFGDRLSAGLARPYGAVLSKDAEFSIVLEDLGQYDAYTHGQLEGTDYEHARLALMALAKLQAPVLGDPVLDEDKWLQPAPYLDQKLYNECYPTFLKRHPPSPEHRKICDWLSENLDAWWATRIPPFCIFHGDFRLDNVMFLKTDGDRAVAMDWGGVTWDSPLRDAAYFLGNGLTIEDRRKWEKDLIREYLDELNKLSKVHISWEYAWEDYCRQSLYGLAQHIPAAGMLPDTDRGKIMFRTLVSRQAQHAIDCNATAYVNPQIISHAPPVSDEGEHATPADGGPLFNESWYFDCTKADGSLGMYARIGRLPNQDCCSFVGGVFRKDEPPVMFIDMKAPLPPSDPLVQKFATDRFSVESKCLDPLSKFAFKLNGTGAAFSDPSAPLRGESGTDFDDVEIDLIWHTKGQAYKKQAQTRYEVACQVSGSIKVGDETFKLDAVPGERNHSWGVRNWWVADWVWSGLHFEDGIDIFTIALGKGPDSTGGSGFIQKNGKLTEVTGVVNEFEFGKNGLPGNLRLRIEPGGLTIDCEPLGEAGLRLIDPEGREAHLPRVMCSAVKSGGVKGVGWLDFNRVVKREPN